VIKTIVIRLLLGIATLFLAVTVAFIVAHGSGNPAAELLGASATPERVAQLQHELGLDRPLYVQYFDFIGGLLRGDLGTSLRYNQPNLELIMQRIPATFELTAVALAIAVVVGIPLGTLAAVKESTWIDRVTSAVALFGQSVPVFWLGMMLILIFAVQLGWLPAGQRNGPLSVVLPAVALSTLPMAQIARLTRSSMAETLGEQFIVAGRARGLSRASIILRHGLRNSSIPVLTIFGLQIGALLSGAVTVEYVFAWPGLGTLATQAIEGRDFTLAQAVVVVGVFVFVIVNLIIDVLYAVIDPRIRRTRA